MSTFIYLYLLYFLCLFISCNAQSQCKYLHQYVCTFYLNYRWGIGIRKWVSVCILGLLLFRQTLYMSDTIKTNMCLHVSNFLFLITRISVRWVVEVWSTSFTVLIPILFCSLQCVVVVYGTMFKSFFILPSMWKIAFIVMMYVVQLKYYFYNFILNFLPIFWKAVENTGFWHYLNKLVYIV